MSNSMRILYIDDDPANLNTVSRVLDRAGYIVLTAKTGQDGLDMAERERPDLILLDILLPDMSGFDVCEQIRSKPRLKKIPVLGISASVIDANRRRNLSSDFDAFLAKPISRVELLTALERLS